MTSDSCPKNSVPTLYKPVHHAALTASVGSAESVARAYGDLLARLAEAGYATVDQLLKTNAVLMKDNLALRAQLVQAECQLSGVFKDTTPAYERFPARGPSGLQGT